MATYTVQSGDTLSKIASRFGTTWQAIAASNGIANPNIIRVGQVLNVSGGQSAPASSSGGAITTAQGLVNAVNANGGTYTADTSETAYRIAKANPATFTLEQINTALYWIHLKPSSSGIDAASRLLQAAQGVNVGKGASTLVGGGATGFAKDAVVTIETTYGTVVHVTAQAAPVVIKALGTAVKNVISGPLGPLGGAGTLLGQIYDSAPDAIAAATKSAGKDIFKELVSSSVLPIAVFALIAIFLLKD
jgi:murein DD-endopeptidase MepM/ murein hydrolase activator NlpD